MEAKNEEARKKLIRARAQLILKYPFFGYAAMGLELTECSDIETAGVDGYRFFYSPEYVDSLPEKQLLGLVAHEVLHCVLEHIHRRGKRNCGQWNIAADYVVNWIVTDSGLQIPSGGCLSDKYTNMPVERVYDKLRKKGDKKHGRLIGSHDRWPSEGEPKGSKDKKPDKKSGSKALSEKDKKDLAKKWKKVTIQAAAMAKSRGNLPGAVSSLIEDVLEPKLSWRDILRDLLTTSMQQSDFRIHPPHKKHLWRGIYLPSTYDETIEVAIGIDTSGSVSSGQFQEFLAEVRSITDQFASYIIHLFFCDTVVHDYIVLSNYDEWPTEFPKADGGTSFQPVFKKIADENLGIRVLVYLTDAEGLFPDSEPEYRVIWVVNNDNAFVPWGDRITLE